jgi:hypothetical protein
MGFLYQPAMEAERGKPRQDVRPFQEPKREWAKHGNLTEAGVVAKAVLFRFGEDRESKGNSTAGSLPLVCQAAWPFDMLIYG